MKIKKPTETLTPATPAASTAEVTKGQAAWQKLQPKAKALAPADLATINIDVGAAALVGIGVAERIMVPALHARFEHIAGPEFDIAVVDELSDTAWATYYTSEQADKARAAGSDARLPAALVERATLVEGRMQKTCEYLLDHIPAAVEELDRLRPGNSYRDKAGDLRGYATLYVTYKSIVEKDPKNYVATDAAEANDLADQILSGLAAGMTPETRAALDNEVRCFTLYRNDYNEARAAGLFIERADPTAPDRYPSLAAATRAAPKHAAAPSDPPAEDPPAAPPAPAKTKP